MAANPNQPRRAPNNTKAIARPVKPTYANARGMTEKERFDHINSFQRFRPVAQVAQTSTLVSAVGASAAQASAPASSGSLVPVTVRDRFYTDGSTATFALSAIPVTGSVSVEIGGVDQDPTGANSAQAWSYSGQQITFTSAPTANRNGVIVYQTLVDPGTLTTS